MKIASAPGVNQGSNTIKKGEKHREFLFMPAGLLESTRTFGKYPDFWKVQFPGFISASITYL